MGRMGARTRARARKHWRKIEIFGKLSVMHITNEVKKDEPFQVFVDRLRDGQTEKIDEQLSAGFLAVNEKELSFTENISVKGEAYLAEDSLVLHLDIAAEGKMPCSICNEPTSITICIEGLYHVESLEEIKTGVFDAQKLVRETVLLETPQFAECHHGKCPQRKEMAKYLKEETPSDKTEDEGYQPFKDLT